MNDDDYYQALSIVSDGRLPEGEVVLLLQVPDLLLQPPLLSFVFLFDPLQIFELALQCSLLLI